jgi:transcriptional regulator with XRE-family HTH domain
MNTTTTYQRRKPKEIPMEAKRLKEFRKAENLTQVQFAEAVSKDQSMIQRYESGVFAIPIEVIRDLREKFLMSTEWFFTGKGSRKIVPMKTNLVTDIKTIETNQNLLIDQVAGMKIDFLNLHAAFYELKHKIEQNTGKD